MKVRKIKHRYWMAKLSYAAFMAVNVAWKVKPPSGYRWCNGNQLAKR